MPHANLTFTDPTTGTRTRRARPTRHEHEAPGDLVHVGLAHSELLPDETKQTASAFMTHALQHFQTLGITVARVLTDDGAS